MILAVFFVEPDCGIGRGGGRSVVRIVEDLFPRCVEDAAVFGIFCINAKHVVAVELVLEADRNIHGTVIDLERAHIATVAGDGEFYGRLTINCIRRNHDNVCCDRCPVIAGFAGSYGEFYIDKGFIAEIVVFEVAEDSLCTLRYA